MVPRRGNVRTSACRVCSISGTYTIENTGVLAMYSDMSEVPTFFYFLPLWAFLFGYYSVAQDYIHQDKNVQKTKRHHIAAKAVTIENLSY